MYLYLDCHAVRGPECITPVTTPPGEGEHDAGSLAAKCYCCQGTKLVNVRTAGCTGTRCGGGQGEEEAGCQSGETVGSGAASGRPCQEAGVEGLPVRLLQIGLDRNLSSVFLYFVSF